ncbi:MAG TPA: carboxypeptidase-like regulatory domain-containing protein, partial [Chitinophagaceae bacterium]|nr:carboxypeptidase-like regulatory domain-containing protein [Chitinophagaceae bacterium]
MELYIGTTKILLPGRNFYLSTLLLLRFLNLSGQETNSRASGRVYSEYKENIDGATVALIHEPTQNTYASITRADGFFSFFNLKPGGPYTVVITSVGYDTLKTTNLYIHLTDGNFLLDSREITEFTLRKKVTSLEEVKVIGRNNFGGKTGIETIITNTTLKTMPTISRSIHDFVRLVPQAKVTGDGVMSLAGQNNRFNAFY